MTPTDPPVPGLRVESLAAGHKLLLKRLSAIGVYWNHDQDADMLHQVTARMIDMCAAGQLRPVIGNTYSFDDLPRALADLRDRGSVGKLVLEAPQGNG